MLKIVKNLEGLITDNNIGVITNENTIEGKIGVGDYMKMYNFTGIFVDLSKTIDITSYNTPRNLGFKNNETPIEINISY